MHSQIDAVVNYAQSFLDCVAPGESFTFQAFHDRDKGQPAYVLHGSIAQHAATLLDLQAKGYGVFWTVNRTNLQGRALQDVTHVRALWLDIDEAGRDIAPICQALAPHAVVQSSPGKHHLYWRVSDCSVDAFAVWLDALVGRWGGDAGAKGINRVMRLPGFAHLKGDPQTVQVVQWAPGMEAYTLAHVQHYLLSGMAPAALQSGPPVDWTDTEAEGWREPLTDAALLKRLTDPNAKLTPAEAFGSTRKLYDLWNPDMATIEAAGTRSEDRMSLLSRLMVLCGGNCERVYQLVRTPEDHPLAVKDGREDLLRSEILAGLRLFLAWWTPKKERREAQIAEARAIGAGLSEPLTPVILTLDEMLDELVYISGNGSIFWRRNKVTYAKANLEGYFAASKTTIETEDGKEKKVSTMTLWLAHPERRMSAGVVTWRPGHPEFCEPVMDAAGHTTAANAWRGLRAHDVPENWREWAGWFEHHIAYLVPVESERRRFLQWLGHMVQHPGELPHTAYLMVTQQTGTGRNWMCGVLARVMRGYVAAGVNIGKILDGKFNGILSRKLLATVDEVREGGDKFARAEALKTVITQEDREIDPKFGYQVVEQNCCRWLILSNHPEDALPFDSNDRRIIVIANPSERREPEYYATLYSLYSQPAFIASVFELLRTMPLDGFNPGAPAPMNDAKRRAAKAMTSGLDQAVEAFVKEWPGDFTTERDLRAYVHAVTGEQPKHSALTFAKRRMDIVGLPGRVMIGMVKDSVLQIRGGAGTVATDELVAQIVASRKAMGG